MEAKRLGASKATKSESVYVANNDSSMPRGPKRNNYTPGQDDNGPVPKKAKNTKRKRGKHSGKGENGKCFNCNKEGHFARDSTKPRKVLPNFNSSEIFVSTHVMVAHSYPYWIVDSGATEHITRDRVEFVEYR